MKAFEELPLPLLLYIDDDAEDRMLMADALQTISSGYRLVTANDARQAFQFLNDCGSVLPSLLILDLNLPGMDGIGIIDHLHRDKRLSTIPMVVFTTSASPSDQQACAKYGVAMITKPISFSDLTVAVKKLLSHCKENHFDINTI